MRIIHTFLIHKDASNHHSNMSLVFEISFTRIINAFKFILWKKMVAMKYLCFVELKGKKDKCAM